MEGSADWSSGQWKAALLEEVISASSFMDHCTWTFSKKGQSQGFARSSLSLSSPFAASQWGLLSLGLGWHRRPFLRSLLRSGACCCHSFYSIRTQMLLGLEPFSCSRFSFLQAWLNAGLNACSAELRDPAEFPANKARLGSGPKQRSRE